MSIEDRLEESKKDIDTIGQKLYDMKDVTSTLKDHFGTSKNVYKDEREALQDIEVLEKEINEIHHLVYGEGISGD